MLDWFSKNKIIRQPRGIAIKESPIHNRGVFSCKKFKPGNIIEIAPVILLDQTERDLLQFTALFSYYFLVNDKINPVALGLGHTSLYNHGYNANAVYSISMKDACITIKACKIITAGEEILLNYNGDPGDVTLVYFPPVEAAT